jgi:photosystem II stability/assembly factor-like uncharacterized protein
MLLQISKNRIFFCVAVCMLTFTFFSCKKELPERIPIAVLNTGQSGRVNDIELLSAKKWIAACGTRNESGALMLTNDGGKNWEKYTTDFSSSVYCIDFLDSLNGFAGGDFLHLWRTSDGGISWTYYWLGDQVPFNEEDRPAVREMVMKNDSCWYFCGGENFGEGVIYETRNSGQTWQFVFRQHEYRDMVFSSENHAVVGGHGSVLTLNESLDHLTASAFQDDFITGLTMGSNGHVYAVTYNGAILMSSVQGLNWSNVVDKNKAFRRRTNWNDITTEGNYLMAVGNEGTIGESYDSGSTWEFSVLKDQPDLYAVQIFNGMTLATSERGLIYQLK